MHKKNKKCLNKVERFYQQIRKDPYFICTVCHRCLCKARVRLFKDEKYILTAELHRSVGSFPCNTVFQKMSVDSIPGELKNLEKLNFNFQEINI